MRMYRLSSGRDKSRGRLLEGDAEAPSRQDVGVTRGKAARRTGLILGMLLLGVLVFAACGSGSTADLDPAPDFEFSLYQGEEVLGETAMSLSDLQGKPLVLNFWAGLCPPCRAEMPDLQEFHDDYGDRVNLFGLDIGPFMNLGSNQNAKDLIAELGITYPAGTTSDETVVREYSILGMPSTFFITADGKIFRKWTGFLTEDNLVEVTEEMLALSSTPS